MQSSPSIAAVIVTCNRLPLLQKGVDAVRRQTLKPAAIYVIDNGSTDGTPEWLAGQGDLVVIRQENLGSAGGQYAGVRAAYRGGHDWVWCMDDDTIPADDALREMTLIPAFGDAGTGFIASVVLWVDGALHAANVQSLK